MKITLPGDAAPLAAIVRKAIAENSEGGLISTGTILAVVTSLAPHGFTHNDVIAVIVQEAGAGYAISFDHEEAGRVDPKR